MGIKKFLSLLFVLQCFNPFVASAYAAEKFIQYVHNFDVKTSMDLVCDSLVSKLSEATALSDNGEIIQAREVQLRQMIASGVIKAGDLKEAKVIELRTQDGKYVVDLIKLATGSTSKVYYIRIGDNGKAKWGLLGSPKALKDLGVEVKFNGNWTLLQTNDKYIIKMYPPNSAQELWSVVVRGPNDDEKSEVVYYPTLYSHDSQPAYRLNASGLAFGQRVVRYSFPISESVRTQLPAPVAQFLLNEGILSMKRLETAEYYHSNSVKTKENFHILEIDRDGPGSERIYLYVAEKKKYVGQFLFDDRPDIQKIEIGLLNTQQGFKRFGREVLINGNKVLTIRPDVTPKLVAPDGKTLLAKISGELDLGVPTTRIFEKSDSTTPAEQLVAGPTDLDAYERERTTLRNLIPQVDGASLASIHGFSAPIEYSISALKFKKRALQRLLFDEYYWLADAVKVERMIEYLAAKKPRAKNEIEQSLDEGLSVRQADLVQYLKYLSQIQESTEGVSEKIIVFSRYLQGVDSKKFPRDIAEVQNFFNQYALMTTGTLSGIQNELAAVTETINYFKRLKLAIMTGSKNQQTGEQLLKDLRVLHKVLTDLSAKNMDGLYLASSSEDQR